MNKDFRKMVINKLQKGEDLPAAWAPDLFPAEKKEYELKYYEKEREEIILSETMALPLQPVRTFRKNGDSWHNMLIFGDNLQVMKWLLQEKEAGKLANEDGTPGVRLVYIDPPFATKQEFRGSQDQKAYQDKIVGAKFLEFLRKRLLFLRELLSDDGTIYLHLDWKKGHYIKVLMDEIFKEQNFVNEIIWQKIRSLKGQAKSFGNVHDTIFCYTKSRSYIYNKQYREHNPERFKTHYKNVEEGTGRIYQLADFTQSGQGEAKRFGNKKLAPPKGKHWIWSQEKIDEGIKNGQIIFTSGGRPRVKRYLDESGGSPIEDIWNDILPMNSQSQERIDYPTQKPERLIERIVNASSNKGDIVLDAFAGSGTTCAVAEKLGRRWIGIDCGKLAIYTIQKRLLNIQYSQDLEPEEGASSLDSITKSKNEEEYQEKVAEVLKASHEDEIEKPRSKDYGKKCKSFALYNAGLYDFSTLKQLQWRDWRFFALELFGCKDEPHVIGGLKLDGKLKGASVLVFNHYENSNKRIDEETIQSIHAKIGNQISSRFFIIAPRGTFDFQQDYIDLEGVRYYALRIPYSVINELHRREFTALQQPNDEDAVNDIVESWGFDFIRPPKVTWQVGVAKGAACLKIKKFESYARIKGENIKGNIDTFSMLMVDFDYDGDVFDIDAVFYAHQLEKNKWEARFSTDKIGEKMMLVFTDIHGNEASEVIPKSRLGLSAKGKGRKK